MRPLIQYDLDGPPTAPTHPVGPLAPPHRHARRPPTKKRKRNHRGPQDFQSVTAREAPLRHWDDPGSAAVGMVYDENEGSEMGPASLAAGPLAMSYADDIEQEEYVEEAAVEGDGGVDVDVKQEGEEEEEEESRELTHEEIWDDAALVDAWNSAEAEYEAYHGSSKAWKTEPLKKSPLWYNKPYTAPTPQPGPSKHKARSKPPPYQDQEDGETEPDTTPLDFHTFVPTHDPSLAIPSDTGVDPAPFFVPPPSTMMVSRDEAFSNALSAMYWSGYWTAVYHCQGHPSGQDNNIKAGATEENSSEADEDEEDLVPAQR